MPGPLEGFRILDLTSVLMGPFATQLLGDLGAEIIKVEPLKGDDTRGNGPARTAGMATGYLNNNRGKKSLAVDLKHPEGRRALLRIASSCDAFISNIRPKALARLGLDYPALSSSNASIIYVGLVGYGSRGRYAQRPAYDDLIQAASGIASLSGARGSEPRFVPLAMADRIVGMAATNALLSGLLHRQKTGVGQAIEVPMFETMAQFVLGDHLNGGTFIPSGGPLGYPRLLSEYRKPFATLDGYLAILPYTDAHWHRFFALVGKPELMHEESPFATLVKRNANVDALYALVSTFLRERTTADWMQALEVADIPAMPLHTLESLIADPHLQDVGFFREAEHPTEGVLRIMAVPSDWSATPPVPGRPAPNLGEHSVEVLEAAGLSTAEIATLVAENIVSTPKQRSI